jgi:hypothetical protein
MKQGLRTFLLRVLPTLLLAPTMAAAWQGTPPRPDLPANPQDLVRQMSANELGRKTQPFLTYRYTRIRPDRKEERQMLETDQLLLGRIVALDGQPLTPKESAQEDRRLQRLIENPEELRDKQKDQQQEDQRIRKIIRALPDGFLYEYGDLRQGPSGEVVVLKFRPNPDFDPPSRETQAFLGMAGTMEISLPSRRLSSLHATLIQDVSFGWGILGKLNRGGELTIEQVPIEGGRWMTRRMKLNFTGRVLIFKALKVDLDQFTSSYRPVSGMSVAEGIAFLKKINQEVAGNVPAQ